ncbi:related to MCX1 protein [Cephalotrichum gorgonifer]|uniref:Related to MCX1 protein n=1 Tax=Cephalotrichum gorgonifer TaxID=2041049 RepID=A0AAE8N5F0_9PEZI|nr:related to MCX1 protein [Cephalotrichum gorgonifer]
MAPLIRPLVATSQRHLVSPIRTRYLSFSSARTYRRRSQDFNSSFSSSFTSSYDPTQDSGRGPMFKNKVNYGVPQFYPRDLKKRVDDYVVGQDRAKKIICATIFNHYQAVRRRQYQELEDRTARAKAQRQRAARDRTHDLNRDHDGQSVEDQQSDSVFQRYYDDYSESDPLASEDRPAAENSTVDSLGGGIAAEDSGIPEHVKIDKSNVLLIGPTGVGKTYILETLSKMLNVPFTISDCNSFTQAGYIGQDVETCIERLLIESNYNVELAQRGIVVLDEFDKIARKETTNGRDVGGEGVQQALLKLVEGTKVTVTVKDSRSTRASSPSTSSYNTTGPTTSQQATPPLSTPGRSEQYLVDTSNILFVFCGAFVGLDKVVLRRVAKPSMGFGSELRPPTTLSATENVLPAEMYSHLPHQGTNTNSSSSFTPLDLTTTGDLQAFGFIPELIGRIHNICALSPLSLDDLYRILTEPRNSLVAQYTALFETYPSHLQFTNKALYAIAERATKSQTGARGLKMEMERVLAESIFDAPMPYVLITEGCVKGTEKAAYWGKDGKFELERRAREEDGQDRSDGHVASLEQFREAGESGA